MQSLAVPSNRTGGRPVRRAACAATLLALLSGCHVLAPAPDLAATPKPLLALNNFGPEVDPQDLRDIETVARCQIEVLRTVTEVPATPTIQIDLYADFEQYREVQKSISPAARSNRGYYSRLRNRLYLYRHDQYKSTAAHEITHMLMRQRIDALPRWLNEGMAEYLEMARVQGNAVVAPPHDEKVRRLHEWLAGGRDVSLRALVEASNTQWGEMQRSDNYASTVSYSFARFLMQNDARRRVLAAVFADLASAAPGAPSAVLAAEYPGGWARLEADWRADTLGVPTTTQLCPAAR